MGIKINMHLNDLKIVEFEVFLDVSKLSWILLLFFCEFAAKLLETI